MNPRGGLGRGLNALIPTEASVYRELPVGVIKPNARQPRREFDEGGLAALADSIRQVGVLQPIVVRPVEDERYEIVAGERRWRAARGAGLPTVPALVVETDDRGALQRAIVENIHRSDLGPLEEAAAYAQMIDEGGLTHEQLGEQLGLSRPAISNALRLLELSTDLQKMLSDGLLSAGHARALLAVEDQQARKALARRVVAENLSVRQTEQAAKSERPGPRPPARPQNAGLLEVAERLSEALETRVSVTMGRRKGKVIVEFGSIADLERIYRHIGGKARPDQ